MTRRTINSQSTPKNSQSQQSKQSQSSQSPQATPKSDIEKSQSHTPFSKNQDSSQQQPPSEQIADEKPPPQQKQQQQQQQEEQQDTGPDADQSAAREVVEPGEHGEVGLAATSTVAIATQARTSSSSQSKSSQNSQSKSDSQMQDSARQGREWRGRRKIRIARVRSEGFGIAGFRFAAIWLEGGGIGRVRDRRDLGRRPGRVIPAAKMVRRAPGPAATDRRPARARARVVSRASPAPLPADRRAKVASPGLRIQADRRVPNRAARVAATSPAAGAAATARTILEVVPPMTEGRIRLGIGQR